MKLARILGLAFLAVSLASRPAFSQTWRQTASDLGSTARVLIIGTRPEDEDNALIAWLSLGRNVETAYLSLTRGESAINVAGTERQSALAVVRTAELLAERERDGAHQYFTRAYDFGPTPSDSIVNAAWPHDSLLSDVVAVVRAFRPHVIVSLFSDSDRDATHRLAARLARETYAVSATTIPLGRWALPPWSVSRLFTVVNGDGDDATLTRVDVGEFDRRSGRSYAELGADIRRLQRTQPPVAAPPLGRLTRPLHLDSARAGGNSAGLFTGIDTSWTRFRGAVSDTVFGSVDSLRIAIGLARTLATNSGAGDSVAVMLSRVLRRIGDVRESFQCTSSTVVRCAATYADLAQSVERVRIQATNALLGAAGVVIDGTVDRQLVGVGDSVPTTIAIFNGGRRPLTVRRVAADSRTALALLLRDSVVIQPDSVARWSANLLVRASDLHWWQVNGLVAGTWMHDVPPGASNVIAGEDRIPTSGAEVTLGIAGVDVPVVRRPLVHRDVAMVRGDNRHPLSGVTTLSILFERTAEYERAGIPVDRLFRVFLSSPRTAPETVSVTMKVPAGLRVDSSTRVAIVPPLGSRNVFFRLRGTLRPSADSIIATAMPASVASGAAATPAAPAGGMRSFTTGKFNYGSITHEYPHIPSQQFIRSSKERLEAVDLRVPPRLHVAYIKGTDDIQSPLGQLQLNVQALDPSLLSVVDLSFYTTILIGAGALANDALIGAVPSLREFMRNGGTIVVLSAGDEIARSGLLPYPVAFDSVGTVRDPDAPIHITDPKSQLLSWPNAISSVDFTGWTTERARNVPSAFDARWRTLVTTGDPDQPQTAATLLSAAVGRGAIVYSSLSLDRELNATHPGAARLFVNLLSAGLKPAAQISR